MRGENKYNYTLDKPPTTTGLPPRPPTSQQMQQPAYKPDEGNPMGMQKSQSE